MFLTFSRKREGCKICIPLILLMALAVIAPSSFLLLNYNSAKASSYDLKITEVMYNPASGLDADEFIELYNSSDSPLDVSRWCFTSGINACFDTDTTVEGNSYILVGADASQFQETYKKTLDLEFASGKLSNSGERIALEDSFGNLVIDFTYSDEVPWPEGADGGGPSLEVKDHLEVSSSSNNWASSSKTGGTPGSANSAKPTKPTKPTKEGATLPKTNNPPIIPIANNYFIKADAIIGSNVTLTYKFNFEEDISVPMFDDGQHGDEIAGDGIYGAGILLPEAGSLIRYKVSATKAGTTYIDPPKKDGMNYRSMIVDDGQTSELPIVRWYMDDADFVDMTTNHTTDDKYFSIVIAIGDQIFDNAEIKIKGQSSVHYPRTDHKVQLPKGYKVQPEGFDYPVDEFMLNNSFLGISSVQEKLSWTIFEKFGFPKLQSTQVRVQKNTPDDVSDFYGHYLLSETYDKSWREREGFQDGALYKDGWDKKTRENEDNSDIQDLLNNVQNLQGDELKSYLYNNLNIPNIINFNAVSMIIASQDWNVYHNIYDYRDSEGTKRWEYLPWDLDNASSLPIIKGQGLNGNQLNLDPLDANLIFELDNRHIEKALFQFPEFREMLDRRLSTLADELFFNDYFEQEHDKLFNKSYNTIVEDMERWGSARAGVFHEMFPDGFPFQFVDSFPYGSFIDDFYNGTNTAEQSNLMTKFAIEHQKAALQQAINDGRLPQTQSSNAKVVINEIKYNPTNGADESYLELHNTEDYAVDVSGWQFDGVELTIQQGSVIPAGGYALVVKNDSTFRLANGASPLILGEYNGNLSNEGETIKLLRSDGSSSDEVSYEPGTNGWPLSPSSDGYSLELNNSSYSINNPACWGPSSQVSGSPGLENSPDSEWINLYGINCGNDHYETFTVTNTDNEGFGSLRQAIIDANESFGPDQINFDIPGNGPHSISTVNYLPNVTEKTFINGASQPGSKCGTSDFVPKIIIKGYSQVHFDETANGSGVRGISMPDTQVAGNAPLSISADDFSVTCSMFGSEDGETLGQNGGISIHQGATNTVIGGTKDSDRNIFAGNASGTSLIAGNETSGQIENNYFGLNSNGEDRLGLASSYLGIYYLTDWEVNKNIFSNSISSTADEKMIWAFGKISFKGNYFGTNKDKNINLGGNSTAIAAYRDIPKVGGINPKDKNYFYNFKRGIVSNGNASVLGNEFVNNELGIESYATPYIRKVEEVGGDTKFTVDFEGGFDTQQDYRVELFSNPTEQNSAGGFDATDLISSTVVHYGDWGSKIEIIVPGTGHDNPTVTATKVDSQGKFSNTSHIGNFQRPDDLQFETSDNVNSVLQGTSGHQIYQTITNLGEKQITNISFHSLDLSCLEVTETSTSGSATDVGTYDSLNWNGLLESGQQVIITFKTDVTCNEGSEISFYHPRDSIYSNGEQLYDNIYDNEDYGTGSDIVSKSEVSVTQSLLNPEDLDVGNTLHYELNFKNNSTIGLPLDYFDGNGPNPFDKNLFVYLVPFDLTFIPGSSTNADVQCSLFPLDTNSPEAQPFFSQHPNYKIVTCKYLDDSKTLDSNETISTTISASLNNDSDLAFTNHLISGWVRGDPDFPIMSSPFEGSSLCSDAGYTDVIDCYAGKKINNYFQSIPNVDLKVEQNLVNPEDVAEGNTVNFDVKVTNDGPAPLNLSLLDGGYGQNILFGDFFNGRELTYLSNNNSNVRCDDQGPGSVGNIGNAGIDHPDYQILVCAYSGSSNILNVGSSITVRLSFVVNTALPTDSEASAILALFGSTPTDVLDTIDNENFSRVVYPSAP